MELRKRCQAVKLQVHYTKQGGNLNQMIDFLHICEVNQIPVLMTFDLGNWSWTGEDVVSAAQRLAPFVVYVHVKAVDVSDHPPKAVALQFGKGQGTAWLEALSFLPSDCPRCIEYRLIGYSTAQIKKQISQLREGPIDYT